MMYLEMRLLFRSLPVNTTKEGFAKAVIAENLLQKPTLSSRQKSMRYLVELYGMDPSRAIFRVLWMLGHSDPESLPQLCLACAYAREPLLRHSFELIRNLRTGESVTTSAMAQHMENGYPKRFSPAMKKSMAQNVNTTWTYGGHLTGRTKKTRKYPDPRPVSAAYTMFVGYLTGLRGERLLDSAYAALVASNRSQLETALSLASAKGLLSIKKAAGIVEFDFSQLLTPQEQAYLHESN